MRTLLLFLCLLPVLVGAQNLPKNTLSYDLIGMIFRNNCLSYEHVFGDKFGLEIPFNYSPAKSENTHLDIEWNTGIEVKYYFETSSRVRLYLAYLSELGSADNKPYALFYIRGMEFERAFYHGAFGKFGFRVVPKRFFGFNADLGFGVYTIGKQKARFAGKLEIGINVPLGS